MGGNGLGRNVTVISLLSCAVYNPRFPWQNSPCLHYWGQNIMQKTSPILAPKHSTFDRQWEINRYVSHVCSISFVFKNTSPSKTTAEQDNEGNLPEEKWLCHSNKNLRHWQSRFNPIQTTTVSVELTIIFLSPLLFSCHHNNVFSNCCQIKFVVLLKIEILTKTFFCVLSDLT